MTTQEMLNLLAQRTKVTNQTKLLSELKSAYEWAVYEIYKSADGPQMLITVGEELTALAATTRDYDLESHLTGGSLLGIQQLEVKLPADVNFTLMLPRDVSNADFMVLDNHLASDPLIASGHPIFYAVNNFGQLRFAPALPATTVIRATYSRLGAAPDPSTNPTQEDGTDLPKMFHNAIVAKACAIIFNTLDDTREGSWETRAITLLNTGIYVAGKITRTARPVETRPFRRGSRRRGI